MTPEQIREVVKITVEELMREKLLSPPKYPYALKKVEKKLYCFFNNKKDCAGVGKVLQSLSDDPYIDVIFLQYRDGCTIERIAEYMDKDVSTIKRNKKRLVLSIYESLEG